MEWYIRCLQGYAFIAAILSRHLKDNNRPITALSIELSLNSLRTRLILMNKTPRRINLAETFVIGNCRLRSMQIPGSVVRL